MACVREARENFAGLNDAIMLSLGQSGREALAASTAGSFLSLRD